MVNVDVLLLNSFKIHHMMQIISVVVEDARLLSLITLSILMLMIILVESTISLNHLLMDFLQQTIYHH